MRSLQDIERAIIKKYRKEIYGKLCRAVNDFNMIEAEDKIAVCLSGGKDSLLLAKCMQELKRHNKISFELKFIMMNPGYETKELENIKQLFQSLNIEAEIFNTNYFEVIKESSSPCFLCSRMRRGALYDKAKQMGCNKIALGHHFNDVIETLLMNQIYNGIFSGMLPVIESANFQDMKLIRPLYYVKEKDIISFIRYAGVIPISCKCPLYQKGSSKREEIKKLVTSLTNLYENADINIFNSMFNVNKNTTKAKE